jgi:ABC-type multidrug transport system ATPase subunit
MNDTALISVDSLTKDYGPLRVLDDVTFSVPKGQIVAVLGPNGAGKTTCFKCILGVTPFEGRITVGGLDVQSQAKEVRRLIGYVPQNPDLGFYGTCYDTLRFIAKLRDVGEERIQPALETVGLWDYAGADTSKLSGGMKQRLALAAAVLSDPPVLLLDEPTASMDTKSQLDFHSLAEELRDAGKTLLVATHYVNRVAEAIDLVLVLEEGRVAFFGNAADILARPRSRSPRAENDYSAYDWLERNGAADEGVSAILEQVLVAPRTGSGRS